MRTAATFLPVLDRGGNAEPVGGVIGIICGIGASGSCRSTRIVDAHLDPDRDCISVQRSRRRLFRVLPRAKPPPSIQPEALRRYE